ncbi:MAG: hypothetical protein ACKVOI_07025 [Dongiaceae bacterium]
MEVSVRQDLTTAAMLLLFCTSAVADDQDDRKRIGVPGYTKADDRLRADVERLARAYLPALAKRQTGDQTFADCKQVAFVDAMITSIEEGGPGKWTETWTFEVCEATVQTPIEFEPDGQGGTFFKLSDEGMTVEKPTAQ